MAVTDGGVQATMPVTPAGYGYGGGDGFGFGGGWGLWIVVFFLFAMMGWGGGWGNGGMNGSLPGYSQTNDFSNLERENDIIRSDICNQFANVNQTLANGFQTIQTSFANAELSRSNTQAALMAQMYQANLDNLQRNCDLTAQIGQGFCTTNNNNQNNTRDIIAKLDQMEFNNMMRDNEALRAENQGLKFQISQGAQNTYLTNYLRPQPVPAFLVNVPYSQPTTGGTGTDGAARVAST